MKIYFSKFALLLSAVFSLSSCRDSSKLPAPKYESIPLIIPEINPQKSFFAFDGSSPSISAAAAAGITRPEFEFVVNPSQGYSELQTVEVYKSFRRLVKDAFAYGPRVKVTDLTSFPATVTINSQDALRGLLTSATSLTPVLATTATGTNRILRPTIDGIPNDAIVFTFEYIMKDGRKIILTPVSADNILLPSSQINAPLAAVAAFK